MEPDVHRTQTVDEVLEAAWPRERRRLRRRLAIATIGRTAVFLGALAALSLAIRLLFGLIVPWAFFAVLAALALVCARPDPEERALLRRGEKAGGTEPRTL